MKPTLTSANPNPDKGAATGTRAYPRGRWTLPNDDVNHSQFWSDARFLLRGQGKVPRARFILALAFALLLFAIAIPLIAAQTGIDRIVIMAGTTTVDTQGRHWAYLVWQATEPASIRSRVFAVYAKPGDANSAALYERQAIVGVQTDPVVIQPLLQRSVHLGQDLNQLEDTINSLFEKLMPDPKLPLAQKLAAVIRGSLENPDHFKNLILMARMHPAVAMSLGWGHAGLIPGPVGAPTTFELRAYDQVTDRDLGVVGRATIRAGQPVVLPAPGAPVEVRDVSPRGDLNAKIRWATPDDLRRLSMLQHGFNIYRVPAALTVANGWHIGPPSTSTLLAAVRGNPTVRRLNRVPVLNPRDYTQAEAADLLSDPETFFFSDWNDRFNPNTSMPQDNFVNGAQFYYFLTARDLLGRDGLVSDGTRITICDRMPPQAPRRVQVVNHYAYNGAAGTSEQRLQVIWNQNEITPLDTTKDYYVYRWTGLPELHQNANDPALVPIAGPIAHLPGSSTNSFLDNGPGAPSLALNAGETIWYTVAAVDSGACGPQGNRSPHSAPAFGVLRDRVGPDAGGGRLEITCSRPVTTFTNIGAAIPISGLSTNARHYRLITHRDRPGIAWAEYFYEITGVTTQRVFVARKFFTPGEPGVTFDFALPKAGLSPNASPLFHCRVGAANGKVSAFASTSTVGPTPDLQIRPIVFTSTIQSSRTAPGGDCDTHDPHGGGDGTIDDLCINAVITEGTKEVKFYRRVDNGPLTLVCQREADFDQSAVVRCCDSAMPAQPADICYFMQQFDEHGNASAMLRVGCVKTEPNAPLPTPILSTITPVGSSTNSRMRLQWFCPPYGVERFEVWIAGNPLPPAKKISDDMTLTNVIELGMPLPGVLPDPKLLMFLTRRIGPAFGTGSVFTVEADVVVGNNYAVFVRAVGKDGSSGPKSNVEPFSWHTTPAVPTVNVPWPARSLPAITSTNFPGVTARMFHTSDDVFGGFKQIFEGVGIRVGGVIETPAPLSLTNALFGTEDPANHVYRSARDLGSLFPLVVYRAQVPNAAFPDVSGDVVQVTPLMEQIAFDRTTQPPGNDVVVVHDPFIRLIPKVPTPGAREWELYLRDTQPVVEDATYQYFLVRLNAETREITEVMPTNPVLITP